MIRKFRDFIEDTSNNSNINQSNLKAFQIDGLFGEHTVKFIFDKCANIYIGENGLGKTTILKCLYYTLTGKFNLLSEMPFEKISLKILDNKIDITKKELMDSFHSVRHNCDYIHYSESLKEMILNYLEYQCIDINNLSKLESYELSRIIRKISGLYNIPVSVVRRYIYEKIYYESKIIEKRNINNNLENLIICIKKYIYDDVIYLPTYRRIENSINNLLLNEDENFASLIHFGMKDVEKSINSIIRKIRTQSMIGYNQMTGILLDEYSRKETNNNFIGEKEIDENIANIVLTRLEEEINKDSKNLILQKIKDGSINQSSYKNLHNLLQHLIDNYKLLKEYDEKINRFARVCNKYLVDKEFRYNPSNLSLSVCKLSNNEEIKLRYLSSGEKQIVSLFAMLYLDEKSNNISSSNKKIILIDEPELSLSMKWQKMLLPDIAKSENCSMLVAMTHSPFIFDNEFDLGTREIHRDKYIKDDISNENGI